MTRIAVTGACGFIGSRLMPSLIHGGNEVVGVGTYLPPDPGEHYMLGDVRYTSTWQEILDRADVIVHLAADSSAPMAEERPNNSLSHNILPLALLVQTAQRMQRRPYVIYPSTITVVGRDPGRIAVDGTEPARPVTVYDLHKGMAEDSLRFASRTDVLDCCILRLANVYGPGVPNGPDRGVLNLAARRALSGLQPQIYIGHDHVRDYLYVDDCVSAILAAIRHRPEGTYAVGTAIPTGIHTAIRHVAAAASRRLGYDLGVQEVHHEVDPIDERSYVADASRFAEETGWRWETPVEAGAEKLVDWVWHRHAEEGWL